MQPGRQTAMTVGKISAACWIVFGVMCVAFAAVGIGISAIHALPATEGLAGTYLRFS